MLRNPFTLKGNWYKANLHTHTTASDGLATLNERVAEYRDHGYDILAITDHRVTNDVTGLSTPEFLVVSGIELHPDLPDRPGCYHLVGVGVPTDFRYRQDAGAKAVIRRVRAAGGEVILAHPYWTGNTINDIAPLVDIVSLEVFNGTTEYPAHGTSSVHWDQLSETGRIVGGSACDDAHRTDDRFMGWTMFRMPRLTLKAFLAALRNGAYYASSGPVIEDFRLVRGTAMLKCSPAVEVRFMGYSPRGRWIRAKGRQRIRSAECDVVKEWRFVRAEVLDADGNRAWTNPIVV